MHITGGMFGLLARVDTLLSGVSLCSILPECGLCVVLTLTPLVLFVAFPATTR